MTKNKRVQGQAMGLNIEWELKNGCLVVYCRDSVHTVPQEDMTLWEAKMVKVSGEPVLGGAWRLCLDEAVLRLEYPPKRK